MSINAHYLRLLALLHLSHIVAAHREANTIPDTEHVIATRQEHDHVMCRKVELELGSRNSSHLQEQRRHHTKKFCSSLRLP